MELTVEIRWDDEAKVWWATNDELPLTSEADTYDELIEIVSDLAVEMAEINNINVDTLKFVSERERRVSA